MECTICSEVFDQIEHCPRLLRCGHTCCQSCLRKVIQDNQIICPTCRNVSITSQASNLPKNFIVLQFLSGSQKSDSISLKSKETCWIHPQQPYIRYCLDDNVPVCADCIITHHSHKLAKLDDKILEYRFQVTKLLHTCRDLINTNKLKKQDILQRKTAITSSLDKELGKVDKTFSMIFQKLEHRRMFIKQQIAEYGEHHQERIQADIYEIEQFERSLGDSLCSLEDLSANIHRLAPSELITSDHPITETLNNYKLEISESLKTSQRLSLIDCTSILYTRASFNPSVFQQEINRFGNISSGTEINNPTVFCFGIQNSVLKFNLKTEKWSQIQIEETNGYQFKNFASATALPTGSILITGGTRSNEVYEYKQNRMTRKSNMLHVRSSHNSVYFNGFVYCIGGYNGSSWHDRCEKISIESYQPTPIANLNYRRCAFSSCVAKGFIYVFGGYDGSKYLDNIERYNISRNKWETLPCVLHRPLQNTGAAHFDENKVIVAGGYNEKGTLNIITCLDIDSLEWSSLRDMNHTRYLMNKFHSCGGRIYAIGGSAQGQNIECFNFEENRWVPTVPYRDFTEDTMYKWAAVITQDN